MNRSAKKPRIVPKPGKWACVSALQGHKCSEWDAKLSLDGVEYDSLEKCEKSACATSPSDYKFECRDLFNTLASFLDANTLRTMSGNDPATRARLADELAIASLSEDLVDGFWLSANIDRVSGPTYDALRRYWVKLLHAVTEPTDEIEQEAGVLALTNIASEIKRNMNKISGQKSLLVRSIREAPKFVERLSMLPLEVRSPILWFSTEGDRDWIMNLLPLLDTSERWIRAFSGPMTYLTNRLVEYFRSKGKPFDPELLTQIMDVYWDRSGWNVNEASAINISSSLLDLGLYLITTSESDKGFDDLERAMLTHKYHSRVTLEDGKTIQRTVDAIDSLSLDSPLGVDNLLAAMFKLLSTTPDDRRRLLEAVERSPLFLELTREALLSMD